MNNQRYPSSWIIKPILVSLAFFGLITLFINCSGSGFKNIVSDATQNSTSLGAPPVTCFADGKIFQVNDPYPFYSAVNAASASACEALKTTAYCQASGQFLPVPPANSFSSCLVQGENCAYPTNATYAAPTNNMTGGSVTGYALAAAIAPDTCGSQVTRTCASNGSWGGSIPLYKDCQQVNKPEIKVTAGPTSETTASFTYELIPAMPSFPVYCRLDNYSPIVCPVPFSLSNLAFGDHHVDYYIDIGKGIDVTKPDKTVPFSQAAGPVSTTTTTTNTTTTRPSVTTTTVVNGATPLPGQAAPFSVDTCMADGDPYPIFSGQNITCVDGDVRFGKVKDPAGSGRDVFIHRVREGDKIHHSGNRSEIAYDTATPGAFFALATDYWISFGIYIDPAWKAQGLSGDRQSFWQIHQESDSCDYANAGGTLGLMYEADGSLAIMGLVDPNSCDTAATTTTTTYYSEPAVRGKWLKYIMHIRFGVIASQSPHLEIWRDGEKIVDSTKPIGFVNAKPDFSKMGIYKWSTSVYGSVTDRVIYSTGLYYQQGTNLYDNAAAALSGL